MQELPYCREPYSKKNWGNPNHSLCSYQGKLKPAIANFLVQFPLQKSTKVTQRVAMLSLDNLVNLFKIINLQMITCRDTLNSVITKR